MKRWILAIGGGCAFSLAMAQSPQDSMDVVVHKTEDFWQLRSDKKVVTVSAFQAETLLSPTVQKNTMRIHRTDFQSLLARKDDNEFQGQGLIFNLQIE